VREAQVRFYLDADILGLAKILTQLRADVTYPGDPGGVVRKRLRPACLITTPATKDSVWIPQVTALGWLIVTRDSKIQSHRAEVGRSGSIVPGWWRSRAGRPSIPGTNLRCSWSNGGQSSA
jgi:hypothetical protein